MKGRKNAHAGEPGGPHDRGQTNPSNRILVVDDDILPLRLRVDVLVRSGYQVDAAEDGAEAWEALQANHYDLLITDNNMPKVSGVELIRKLRAARMALPVIMATGILPEEEFVRSPWLEPDATLVKPFTSEEMLRTVKRVLRAPDSPIEPSEPLSISRSQPLAHEIGV